MLGLASCISTPMTELSAEYTVPDTVDLKTQALHSEVIGTPIVHSIWTQPYNAFVVSGRPTAPSTSFACGPLSFALMFALSPAPQLKGAGLSSTGRYLRVVFEGCTRQHSGHRGNIGKPMRKDVREMQPSRKAKLLSPHKV